MGRAWNVVAALAVVASLPPWGPASPPLAEAALDPVRGPREHPVVETFGYDLKDTFTSLNQQLLELAPLGDNKLVEITNLITAGADPNTYDENHYTPLHYAVIKGQRFAVEVLAARGAHPDARDAWMRTPVHLAAVFGWGETNPSTLTELYAAGANFNAGDQADNTPLHLAASEGWTETCKQLVEYGARIDPVNRWAQQTPLGSAVANGHTETAAALRLLGSANETVSHLESELTKCTWDNQKHCTNATLDCWNDGAPEGAAPGECTVHCDSPPCEAKCVGDESNTAIPGGNWGCHLNNFFPGPQPILDPFPPKPSGIRGVIQGTTVS